MNGRLPEPADFPEPPSPSDLERWTESDRVAYPARVAKLRARLAAAGLDAYFGIRPEHARYLTGFALAAGEERVAGDSGRFLVSGEKVQLLADSRYLEQAKREAAAEIVEVYQDLPGRWPDWARRMAELVRPGGELAGFFYMNDNERGPPFGADRATLDRLRGGAFALAEDEAVPPGESIPVFQGREIWQVWKRPL